MVIGSNIFQLRALDGDLSGIMKAAQPFQWDRIPFVLEAPVYFLFWFGTSVLENKTYPK